jgi:hypothetical protein
MSFLTMLTFYLAAALALVSGVFIGLAILISPVESGLSDVNYSNLASKTDRQPAGQIPDEPRQPIQTFRYGPDVNHGRSDTPVHYSQQALREAKSAPVKQRKQPYKERLIQDPGVAIGFAPNPTSGH